MNRDEALGFIEEAHAALDLLSGLEHRIADIQALAPEEFQALGEKMFAYIDPEPEMTPAVAKAPFAGNPWVFGYDQIKASLPAPIAWWMW